MAKKNGPTQLLNLEEIFKDHFFLIPDYQRGFSWEIEQLEDLKKDIKNLVSKNHMYYTGTIVGALTEDNNHYKIVDGQQRLTSLVILLNCIYQTVLTPYC